MPSVFDDEKQHSVFDEEDQGRSVFDEDPAKESYQLDPLLFSDIAIDPVTGQKRIPLMPEAIRQMPAPTPEQIADLKFKTGRGVTGAMADAGELLMTPFEIADELVTDTLNLPTAAQNKAEEILLGNEGRTPLKPLYEAGKPVVKLAPEFTEEEIASMTPLQQKITGAATSVAKGAESLLTPGNIATLPVLAGKAAKPVAAVVGSALGLKQPEAGRIAGEISADPNATDFEKAQAIMDTFGVTPAFAGTMLYGAGKTPILERVSPKTAALYALADELGGAPSLEPSRAAANRRLGINVEQNPSAIDPANPLVDKAVQEANQVIKVPGEVPAIELLRREMDPPVFDILEPTRRAERVEGGGEAPYGKVSYQRAAESPTPARTQKAMAAEGKLSVADMDQQLQARGYNELRRNKMSAEEKAAAVREPIPSPEADAARYWEMSDAISAEKDMAKKFEMMQKFMGEAELIKNRNPNNYGAPPERPTADALRADDKTIELTEPPSLNEVNSIVEQFAKDFPGLPKINVVSDYHGLPDTLHQTAYRQGTHPTAIKGAMSQGEAWLNRAMLDNAADVRATLMHEVIGHMATDAKLGNRMKTFFEQTHDSLKDTDVFKDVMSRYPKANKSVLGSEMIAKLSENTELNPTLWNKIVGKVREFLRDLGFVKNVTENDIKVLLRSAADAMKKKAAGKSGDSLSVGKPQGPKRTLDDVAKIFEPEKKQGPTAKQRAVAAVEAVRTGVSSKFRPLNRLAEDIAKAYGLSKPKDIAGIAEQLKGSSGKAEATIFRFDRDVANLVKGNEGDFNSFMFLNRSLDRLKNDLKDIQKAMETGEEITLNRRSVGDYTIPELEGLLGDLKKKVGDETFGKLAEAGDKYQKYMDDALRLQVESGRMSPEVYNTIKEGNQFYAPFKVMKYIEETSKPEGTGAKVDTVAAFTKAMKGIDEGSLKLGDMLSAARQSIMTSRILAEKNNVMRQVSRLADLDADGLFIKKLKTGQDAPRGMETVNVMENGRVVKYAVDSGVKNALDIFGQTSGGVISRALGFMSRPFRAGATALNVPFQASNLMADVPRAALVSKYGVRGLNDLIMYPFDFLHALMGSMAGNLTSFKPKVYLDFLESGAAGSVVQDYLTPKALEYKDTSGSSVASKVGGKVIRTIPEFAKAIEETSKVLGIKRAMRTEGVESGAQLASQVPEAVTEVRRFSGSPDFGRQGSAVEAARLNLIYMFLNARIQGAIADVGRLSGRDGAKTAARTWANVTTAVGIPTAALYFLNQQSENKEDYQKRSDQEKQNYWMIPKYDESGKPRYIKGSNGEDIRDYWRIPKREVSKWISNLTEAGIRFAEEKDPASVKNFAQTMIEELSPVNIQGNTAQERLESVASSLNPVIKTPIELASGRDLYRHKSIVPDRMKEASPEEQYLDRTPEFFKKWANAMPDVAPEVLRSPLMLENMTRNITAGLITQFMPRKPVEGRSKLENNPLLARFQGLSFLDDPQFDEKMKSLEREAADESLARYRSARKLIDDNRGKELDEFIDQAGDDEKLIRRVVDLWVAEKNGITPEERRIIGLPVVQRAKFVADKLKKLDPKGQEKLIEDYALKRIITEDVMNEIANSTGE